MQESCPWKKFKEIRTENSAGDGNRKLYSRSYVHFLFRSLSVHLIILQAEMRTRGACTHPCRWKYSIVEETRPGEVMPVYENERGTYIFNSKDLVYDRAHR